jgi:hypothetical protein
VNFADRAVNGLCRIGGSHDFAIPANGLLTFENLHDDRARNHELDQFAKERPLAMHRIEFLGLLARNAHAFLRYNQQARLFDEGVDRAG